MASHPSLSKIAELLDEKLRVFRPERYTPGATSSDWKMRAVNAVKHHFAEDPEALEALLMSLANTREGEATKFGNNLLRKAGKDRQLPLDWFMYADYPIAFEISEVDEDGEEKTVKQRVKIGFATSEDFRAWDRTERKRAERDYQRRLEACDGARFIAEYLDVCGLRMLNDISEDQSA